MGDERRFSAKGWTARRDEPASGSEPVSGGLLACGGVLARGGAPASGGEPASGGAPPFQGAQLRAYLDDNLGVFLQRMKEAREGDRKQYSVRACKRLGLPDKKDRGRCAVKEETYVKPSKEWVKILWRRSGWFGAVAKDGRQALLFVYTWHQKTSYMAFERFRKPGAEYKPQRVLLHTFPCNITPEVKPLSD